MYPIDWLYSRTLGQCSTFVFTNPFDCPDDVLVPSMMSVKEDTNASGRVLTLIWIGGFGSPLLCSCLLAPELLSRLQLQAGSPFCESGHP